MPRPPHPIKKNISLSLIDRMRTCLDPSFIREYKGLKETRALMGQESRVFPIHRRLSSCPSVNVDAIDKALIEHLFI